MRKGNESSHVEASRSQSGEWGGKAVSDRRSIRDVSTETDVGLGTQRLSECQSV